MAFIRNYIIYSEIHLAENFNYLVLTLYIHFPVTDQNFTENFGNISFLWHVILSGTNGNKMNVRVASDNKA